MREVEVVGVRVEMPESRPVVLLRDAPGRRVLPIWIAPVEASAIAFAQQGVKSKRPLTHDLLADVIAALGDQLTEVRVTEIRDDTFYADLVFRSGTIVSARPSDSIALALRVDAKIFVADDLLDEAAIATPEEDEDEVEKFREFLDQVTAEDFEADE